MKASNDYNINEDGHKEGELYKTVKIFGKVLELRYGYYDDIDRNHPPDIIYPDFKKAPIYTDNGEPFVTMMQDACPLFLGDTEITTDTTCADCDYFLRSEEWFGICKNDNKKTTVFSEERK